jgi:hypothetical protein
MTLEERVRDIVLIGMAADVDWLAQVVELIETEKKESYDEGYRKGFEAIDDVAWDDYD